MAMMGVVGSRCYGLSGPESDLDISMLVIPTIDDLYDGHRHTKQRISDGIDVTVNDIRRFPDLLWKSSAVAMDLLFSPNIAAGDGFEPTARRILARRDRLAAMNLPGMWAAFNGQLASRLKRIDRSRDGTSWCKEAMHAYRTLTVIDRFAGSGFEDMGAAIRPVGDLRSLLLEIRAGEHGYDECVGMIRDLRDSVVREWGPDYTSAPRDTEALQELSMLIRGAVTERLQLRPGMSE